MDYATKADLLAALTPLATREEVRELVREGIQSALAPYATREEMRGELREVLAAHPTREEMRAELRAALAAYPTRDEMREEAERTRRYFDVVAESLTGDTRLLAEGYVGLDRKIVSVRAELDAEIAALAKRVTRIEVSRG